jgi:hypothetical protein
VEAVSHAEVRHGSNLEVHATVVYAFDVCGEECLGVDNPVHNVLVVLALMGWYIVSVEFNSGIDGCEECPQGRDPAWLEVGQFDVYVGKNWSADARLILGPGEGGSEK